MSKIDKAADLVIREWADERYDVEVTIVVSVRDGNDLHIRASRGFTIDDDVQMRLNEAFTSACRDVLEDEDQAELDEEWP